MPQTQTLFLLRHAEAEPWYPGVPDVERRLSERGLTHMVTLSKWAASAIDPPELILCSTATRTRQTLESLGPEWINETSRIRLEADMYEATTGFLHHLASEAFLSHNRVMLVGHNPGLGSLSQKIIEDNPGAEAGTMAPGTLAIIEFQAGWSGNESGGQVKHWLSPNSS